MERAIDPLLTIDAKLWADEFMATKQRLGDAEFDHVMMLGWFANAIMRGYDAGRDSMTHTPPHPDAQATIAALQARVQELEAIKIPDDAFTYCAYCGKKSPVDEHNEDLAAHIKVCPKHPMRDVESQLTQRTAELEAAKRANTRYGLEIKDLRKTIDEWRAELERVRGELAETKEEVKCLDEQVSALNQGCLEYERLIAALPKMEGEIRVIEVATDEWHVYDTIFATKAGADNYAALLQHRQGMEG